MFTPAQMDQYRALREGTACARLERTLVRLSGTDRATLLHKFCTQDVLAKQPGQGGEAFILNVQGKIVGYVYFFLEEEAIALDGAAGQAEAIINHLDRYVIREDVRFEDLSTTQSVVLVAGPRAAELLTGLTGIVPPGEMYGHVRCSLNDVSVVIRRVPFLIEDSFFLSFAAAQVNRVRELLAVAGAELCDEVVIDARRIESATPLYGLDVTLENLPQEVQRDAVAIHFRKGCYLGQETVARIDALGHVNKLLSLVKFPAAQQPPPTGTELKQGEKIVGRVTSSCWSPQFNCPLALAYLRREVAVVGTRIGSAQGAGEVQNQM